MASARESPAGAGVAASLDERRRPDLASAIELDSAQLLRQHQSNRLLDQQRLAAAAAAAAGLRSPAESDSFGQAGQFGRDERKHLLASDKLDPAASTNCADQLPVASLGRGRQLATAAGRQKALLARQESTFEQEEGRAAATQLAASQSKAHHELEENKAPGELPQRKNLKQQQQQEEEEERRAKEKRAKEKEKEEEARESCACCPCKMFAFLCSGPILIPLLLVLVYSVAIYSLPFVKIQPATVAPLPTIPFNFQDGPLKPSSASAFEIQHLFKGQLHGPESLAFDAQANLYMAIEGGFILYAHLNKTSAIRRAYLESALGGASAVPSQLANQLQPEQQQAGFKAAHLFARTPALIKIAELNGLKPATQMGPPRPRAQRDNSAASEPFWRRDCQLDEQIYGQQLFSTTEDREDSAAPARDSRRPYHFRSHVKVSRCSKPLGIRLSRDESALYVIDTLNGLYRVNLRQAERPFSNQRQVSKLIDFKASQLLPAVQLDAQDAQDAQTAATNRITRYMNVSLRALDDLVIDFGAGTQNGDMIYLTVASQIWPAISFVYDNLEGRPSGLVVRFDTGSSQLVVLEPARLAHVRTSNYLLEAKNHSFGMPPEQEAAAVATSYYQPSVTLGAPRLDENDLFDDRPLNFPNGLELMDDRQALLITDTSNKRIIKHWIRGPRRGTSDLWAWTPNYPDNIRRGYDGRSETYWVVGCGRAPKITPGSETGAGGSETREQLFKKHQKLNSGNLDMFSLLQDWPRVRKFALKNIYFAGSLVEFVGAHILKSVAVQDYGYELKMGSNLCSQGCAGMMVLQYNQNGDIIRSIHSRDFPNDLTYYSQVSELIDGQEAQHSLYLGSPSYNYVTKLILPTETRPAWWWQPGGGGGGGGGGGLQLAGAT